MGQQEEESDPLIREKNPRRPTVAGFPAGDTILRAKTGGGRQWSLVDDKEQLLSHHLLSGLWKRKMEG